MTLMTYFNDFNDFNDLNDLIDLIDLKVLLAQTPLSLKQASTHLITNY